VPTQAPVASPGLRTHSSYCCCCCHTHFLCAFISAMAPDTDFVATAAVLCTLKRPRTHWGLALAPRHRCPAALLLLSAVCIVFCVEGRGINVGINNVAERRAIEAWIALLGYSWSKVCEWAGTILHSFSIIEY
jgi:hypothetical protein